MSSIRGFLFDSHRSGLGLGLALGVAASVIHNAPPPRRLPLWKVVIPREGVRGLTKQHHQDTVPMVFGAGEAAGKATTPQPNLLRTKK